MTTPAPFPWWCRSEIFLPPFVVGITILFGGCVASQQQTHTIADRVEKIEQTEAVLSARVDKIETNVDLRIKADVEAAIVHYESTKTNNVVNDVWPWLLAGLAALLIAGGVALVVVWLLIRAYSYLKQKPIWERAQMYYVIDKSSGRELTARVEREYNPIMSRLIGTEDRLPPVCSGDAFVLKDWLVERGYQWGRDFYIRKAGGTHDSKGVVKEERQ